MPWLPLSIFASALLPLLFGGRGQQQQQTTTQETQQRRPMDPAYWPMSQMLMKALLQRGDLFSGFGMPEGTSGWFPQDMMTGMREMLAQSWPAMMKKYQGRGGNVSSYAA